jgi:hypothetical protein
VRPNVSLRPWFALQKRLVMGSGSGDFFHLSGTLLIDIIELMASLFKNGILPAGNTVKV